jgi:very-short-patch-repair endonuclease
MPTQIDAPTPDAAMRALAGDQYGVVSRMQLLDAGLTRAMVGERVRRGHLIRLHRGVYAVGHRELKREGHWLAAVLAVGPGAVLSHRQAAALHGFRPTGGVRIDVTSTGRAGNQPGIRTHHTRSLDDQDTTIQRGIPVTTVARTLVDLAGVVPHDHLRRALREADRLRLLDVRALEACRVRTIGRRGPGDRALREALAELKAMATTLTRSPLEDAFLALLQRAGLPKPEVNAHIEGMEVDMLWRERRVVAELDGWDAHHTRHAFEMDRTRDATLTAAGYQVVRFTHRHVLDGGHVTETLRRLGIR